MFYISTRGKSKSVESSYAIYKGLADDGGLYVPKNFYKFNFKELNDLSKKNYIELAYDILNKYLIDYTKEELQNCIEEAYTNTFLYDEITPLKTINKNISILELFHGPTSAFKDLALQIMPKFMGYAIKKQSGDKKIFILVATSGDTGKAALEGFKNAEQTELLVFYPSEGVSKIQKLQMQTQEGSNVNICAIKGNFDDTQTAVKNLFTNADVIAKLESKGYIFSSANSMNWGRLVPQIVYYFSAYFQAVNNGSVKFGDPVNFAVPTGNFGDILAGYYAKKMGLPINKLICASNDNKILTDFFDTGIYNTNREFYKTSSPSMDILISSNLERFLYDISGNDSELINGIMHDLSTKKEYSINSDIKQKMAEHISADYASEHETDLVIKKYFTQYNYVLDPHTAVAACIAEKEQSAHTIIVATASPYKFSSKVLKAISGDFAGDEFDNIQELNKLSGAVIPNNIINLNNKKILFDNTINKDYIFDYVNELIDNM